MEETDLAGQVENFPRQCLEAYTRISSSIYRTPLLYSQQLSKTANVYLKLENEQLTGSFKVRGACNKIFYLKETNPALLEKGVILASSGNHGIGCLYAANQTGAKVEVYCYEGASASKVALLRQQGALVTLYGHDCVEAEDKARQIAEERGQVYISPYNDWAVMAGQATIGVEIYEQLPTVDCVFVSVGGGGSISGIALYLKSRNPNIQIVGCQAQHSKVMYESVKAGRQVHEETLNTLSDGTAGGVEEGAITIPLCSRYVDHWILVSEEQIGEAVYMMLETHHKVVEGAAGVAIAAYLNNQEQFAEKNVVLLVCGSNIGIPDLKFVIEKHGQKYR